MKRNLLKALGPGILFAGAAIGTSHLVQSTRAGAVYGLALIGVILLANLIKYPAFRFGPRYVAATGRSLVEGYRTMGRWAVLLISISQLAIQSIVIAAIAITTAGIAASIVPTTLDSRVVAALLVVTSILVLKSGGYGLLDKLTKVFIAVLTIATVAATILVLPRIDYSTLALLPPNLDAATFAFMVALMGFMPSAMDLSILHSLWSVAKARQTGRIATTEEAMFDFNIGYIGSTVLAICFVLMGAGVMYAASISPADGAVPFASQVIALYTSSLGEWSGILVGVSAFGVMFTTLITILDGMPRVHAAAWLTLTTPSGRVEKQLDGSWLLLVVTIGISLLSIVILFKFMGSFREFIDFVTISAFVVGPLIGLFNHIVVMGPDVAPEDRPSLIMRVWSAVAIIILSAVSIAYLVSRFSGGL